jgi:hypothetical protein
MGHVDELVGYAEELRLESADLDLAVHDCAQDARLGTLNRLVDEGGREEHITGVEADASAINNGGLGAQIVFLLDNNSQDEVRKFLRQLARHKCGPRDGGRQRP